jgi:putative DNA primase/helicase
MLPDALKDWCSDIADRMQVPLDFPAVAAMAALGTATMRRACIQPKQRDTDWTEYPNLWGAIVAPPGMMKSPVLDKVAAPLREIENRWRVSYEDEATQYAATAAAAELEKRAWEQAYLASLKKGGDRPQPPANGASAPRESRLRISDSTFEATHKILADNPAGVGCWRDELSGWLAGLDRQGREAERAFYLESWSGHSGFTIDRIGRGSIYVKHCCLSVFGGIQPARLRSYLEDALKDGPSNDGLIQRFQLLVWPDFEEGWQYIDRSGDVATSGRAKATFERIVALEVDNPLRLKFSEDAQQLFIGWLTALEGRIRSPETPAVLQAHFAKYRKLMPALALLCALADGRTDSVSLRDAQRAAMWCEYLEPHARRVYGSKASPETIAAQTLARKLQAGWHSADGRFSLRDTYEKHWAGLTTPDEARAAVLVLCEYGWAKKMATQNRAGRPSEVYMINPLIREVM